MPSTIGMPDFSEMEDKQQISVVMGQWQEEVQLNLMRYMKEHAEWVAAGNLTETDSDSDLEVIIPCKKRGQCFEQEIILDKEEAKLFGVKVVFQDARTHTPETATESLARQEFGSGRLHR